MWPYWLLFAFVVLGAILVHPDYRSNKGLGTLVFAFLALSVMIGFRYRVGVDFSNYRLVWDFAGHVSLGRLLRGYTSDPIFYTLLWVLRNLGLPYWSLNLVCGAIFAWGLVRFAQRLPNPWLSIAVAVPYLVIVIAMSGVRQATALGFVFLALNAFMDGRTGRFVALTFAGAMFHASAILTLPFAGLSIARRRIESIALLTAIALLGAYLFSGTFSNYSQDYLEDSTLQSAGTLFRIAMAVIAAGAYFLFVRNHFEMPDYVASLWRNYSLVAFGSVALFLVVPSSTALDRMLLYLYPLQVLALSLVPYRFSQPVVRRFVVFGLIAYLATIQFVYLNFGVHRNSFVPYRMYGFSN